MANHHSKTIGEGVYSQVVGRPARETPPRSASRKGRQGRKGMCGGSETRLPTPGADQNSKRSFADPLRKVKRRWTSAACEFRAGRRANRGSNTRRSSDDLSDVSRRGGAGMAAGATECISQKVQNRRETQEAIGARAARLRVLKATSCAPAPRFARVPPQPNAHAPRE